MDKKAYFIWLFAVFFFIMTPFCYCYLDPGTGSYIFQMLIAGIASALLAVKIFWGNIREFFVKLLKPKTGKKS